MSREILFRGKRTDNGEWAEGNFITNEKDVIHAYIGYLFGVVDGIVQDVDIVEVIPITVCQYTGLTDKNGRKIFEGDIVKGVAYSTDFIGYIIWIDEIAGFGVRYFNTHREPTAWENSSILKAIQKWKHPNEFQAEIIGNMFDNPELIDSGGNPE